MLMKRWVASIRSNIGVGGQAVRFAEGSSTVRFWGRASRLEMTDSLLVLGRDLREVLVDCVFSSRPTGSSIRNVKPPSNPSI